MKKLKLKKETVSILEMKNQKEIKGGSLVWTANVCVTESCPPATKAECWTGLFICYI